MWTYTAYLLYRYLRDVKGKSDEEITEITFEEFSDFIFKHLWLKYGVCFHDSQRDLFYDLAYLKELNVIDMKVRKDHEEIDCKDVDYEEVVERRYKVIIKIHKENRRRLEDIARIVEQSHVTIRGLYEIYKDRIDEAIKSLVKRSTAKLSP